MDDATLAALWLAELLGPACARTGEILQYYGSPLQAYRESLQAPFFDFLSKAQLERLRTLTLAGMAPLLERCRSSGVAVLVWGEPDYPANLLDLPDPPVALYATGDVSVLNGRRCVGMVGSRRPSPYGVQVCAELGRSLAEAGAVPVSGLADGLDSQAHQAAVNAGQPTIGVLGTDINITYPSANRRLRRQMEALGGAVVSEYAPGTPGRKHYFLQRNRLIAALSDVLCVVEARERSGTMSTVRRALEYGRPVYAVPGSLFSPLSAGTNELIGEGQAQLVENAGTLLSALGLSPGDQTVEPASAEPLSMQAEYILRALGPVPVSLEEICAAVSVGAGEALAALTELELAGRVAALPGRRYLAR